MANEFGGIPNGPIPGENFTSDTRNYPWHRPPEYTNLDEAFEFLVESVLDEDASIGIITMLEMDTSVCVIVDMILTAGIGNGKWTVDYAMIMAGPLSHVICMMGRRYGIEDIVLGTRIGKQKPPTKAYFDAIQRVNSDRAEQTGEDLAASMGLAGDGEGAGMETPEAPAAPAEGQPAPGPAGPTTGIGGAPAAPAIPGPPTDTQPVSPEGEQAAMLGQTEEGV